MTTLTLDIVAKYDRKFIGTMSIVTKAHEHIKNTSHL